MYTRLVQRERTHSQCRGLTLIEQSHAVRISVIRSSHCLSSAAGSTHLATARERPVRCIKPGTTAKGKGQTHDVLRRRCSEDTSRLRRCADASAAIPRTPASRMAV